LSSGALLIADVVKVFNPQSPQARAVFDLAIVVIAISFLTAAHQKNSNETGTKGELNEMKSRIGTCDHLVAATHGQFASGRREGKAKM
jgi:hypothetical protein